MANDQLHLQALQAVVRALGALDRTLSSSLRTTTVAVGTFAALPATPVEGMLATVTDSNTNTWGATVASGGANRVLAYYDGTNWTVAGK
jgi:hypothetical protein